MNSNNLPSNKLLIVSTPQKFPLGEGVAWEAFELGALPKGMTLKDSCILVDAHKPPHDFHKLGNKILILGPDALKVLFPGMHLEKARATLMSYRGVPCCATFHPQDAQDLKYSSSAEDDSADFSDDDKEEVLTQKTNYRFWMRADTRKFLSPIFPASQEFKFMVAPGLEDFLRFTEPFLKGGHTIYLDIETDPKDWSLNCIGLAFDNHPYIFVLPAYDYTNKLQYGQFYKILARLSVLLARNTIVAHNAQFDLFILSYFYRVLFNWNIFDTMIAHHRLLPEVEKSLGHVISYWTWLPYHKDQNFFRPRNSDEQFRLYKYNALDVYALREVHLRMLAFIREHPERARAIYDGTRCVYPYLCATLEGILVDDLIRVTHILKCKKTLTQWLRIARMLKGDKAFNPNSTQQCIEYFHNKLKYKVQGYTKEGKPSLDSKNMYKLRIAYNNPLLDVVIAYRFLVKEKSGLEFVPYEKPNYNSNLR